MFLVFCMSFSVQAQEYVGRVVGVTDGDTITLLDPGKQQIKVRLAEIDTPESGQPYGKRAKQELSGLVFNKMVTVKVQDIDRYGRTVGRVYANSLDVNAEMVKRGAAWVYRQYAKDQSLYSIENQARQDKVGLWGLPESEQIPPWEWRHSQRGSSTGKKNQIITNMKLHHQETGQAFTCGSKTTCKQMTSCSEARFYLEKCGLNRLDRDNDGIPCESICR
jgi:endonuclease YncB( thermonuclease family)